MKITRQLRLDALATDGTAPVQLTISWEGNRPGHPPVVSRSPASVPRTVARLGLLLPAALLPRLALADGSAGVGSGLDRALTTLLFVVIGFMVLGAALFFLARRGRVGTALSRPAAPRPYIPPPPVRLRAAVATPAPAVPVARPQPGLPKPLPYLLWFFAVVLAGFLLPLLLAELSSERFGWWAYSFTLGFFYLCVLLVPPHFIALLYYLIRYLNRPYA